MFPAPDNHYTRNQPPYSQQAEQAVLAAALSNRPESLNYILREVRTEDFYDFAHQQVFASILRIIEANTAPVDIITVSDDLDRHGQLGRIGGPQVLQDLVKNTSLMYNDEHYVSMIKEYSRLRGLMGIFQELHDLCKGQDAHSSQIVDHAAQKLIDFRKSSSVRGFEKLGEVLVNRLNELSAMAAKQEDPSIKSGYSNLDHVLGGLRKGSLLILAARPGMGKSALAFNIVQKVSGIFKIPSAIFSLEMSKEEVSTRFMTSLLRIDSQDLLKAKFDDKEGPWKRITDRIYDLYETPVYIDDRSTMNPMEMMSGCRELKLKEPNLGLIVVDYLQLMGGGNRRSDNRQQEISEISRNLKILARELDVPVIALSQLSRACESRPNKRPMLSDLRESGAIEQDADAVLFLYRDDYYLNNKEPDQQGASLDPDRKEKAELIIAKNRHGPIKNIELGWEPRYVQFFEFDYRHAPADLPPAHE